MLRLFKVMDGDAPLYFDSRRAAKAKRDDLRDDGKTADVLRGPDHRRGETFDEGTG